MSEQVLLKIFERDTTITPGKLRSIGYIPATIYGKAVQPQAIQIKAHDFELAWFHGVRHFRLEGLGNPIETQVKQVQLHNTKDAILHVEFFIPSSAGTEKKLSPKNAKKEANTQPGTVMNPSPSEESEQALLEEALPVY